MLSNMYENIQIANAVSKLFLTPYPFGATYDAEEIRAGSFHTILYIRKVAESRFIYSVPERGVQTKQHMPDY